MTKFFGLVLGALFLTSCGYHFGRGEILQRYSTVCVPYVEGDEQGFFTTTLIRQITSQGCLAYRSSGADLALRVCLLEPVDTNIGFIYAPKKNKKHSKSLKKNKKQSRIIVSHEARLMMAATVSLIDRRSGECVLGPMEIRSWIDYDFEPDLGNVNFHAFSLGQLERHNLAQDAACRPLHVLLAEKIVDYVNNSW
jgi:hypothetical protein